MEDKITEVYNNYLKDKSFGNKERNIPLPKDKFIIKESDFELLQENKSKFLDKDDRNLYLILVGSLISISLVFNYICNKLLIRYQNLFVCFSLILI